MNANRTVADMEDFLEKEVSRYKENTIRALHALTRNADAIETHVIDDYAYSSILCLSRRVDVIAKAHEAWVRSSVALAVMKNLDRKNKED